MAIVTICRYGRMLNRRPSRLGRKWILSPAISLAGQMSACWKLQSMCAQPGAQIKKAGTESLPSRPLQDEFARSNAQRHEAGRYFALTVVAFAATAEVFPHFQANCAPAFAAKPMSKAAAAESTGVIVSTFEPAGSTAAE